MGLPRSSDTGTALFPVSCSSRPPRMLIAVDAQYLDEQNRAGVGAVLMGAWEDEHPVEQASDVHIGLQPYTPGEFYRRELPCLLPLIERLLTVHAQADIIIIDGYVDLAPHRPGLGRHLFNALSAGHTVIGVAKNPFQGSNALPVQRGSGRNPLWVTSTGDQQAAALQVESMHGPHRLPTLLKRADRLARDALRS